MCVDMSKEESEGKPEVWVFPAEDFKEYAIEIRSKEGYRGYRLDLEMNQGGGCGKGAQSPLPVSNGSPHIRIRKCLVGGR